ncbi:MAG: hypothetical protein GXP55_02000, partial [Deltaproteobacteria bacterium]|nr:hypothetical protein [Deltaproteobacteria bacterium]
MTQVDAAKLERAPAFRALRQLAADGLGVQLVLIDSDGALAHRRGGVLEAVSAPCRAALFSPDAFACCDRFYEEQAIRGPNDGENRCPFALSARSVDLPGGLRLVASGYQRADATGPDWSALERAGVDPSERDAGPAATLGEEGSRLLDALLTSCRE